MRIYIASSWRNQHGVEMLTALLRKEGHEVLSWIENNYGEGHGPSAADFEQWIQTNAAQRSFLFDVDSVTQSDLVIYYGPAGTDAWAEVGVAWANHIPIFGLWARGEPSGLMRKMVKQWFHRLPDMELAIRML